MPRKVTVAVVQRRVLIVRRRKDEEGRAFRTSMMVNELEVLKINRERRKEKEKVERRNERAYWKGILGGGY